MIFQFNRKALAGFADCAIMNFFGVADRIQDLQQWNILFGDNVVLLDERYGILTSFESRTDNILANLKGVAELSS
jgi:hypothetical protein